MVRKHTRWVIGATVVAASMALTGVAVATGPTGSVVSEVIGAGSMPNGAGFAATPNTNTIVADFTFGPNSATGWHTHPGKTLVTVKSGTFTVYHANDCEARVYGPGDAFVELPSTVHIGRNERPAASWSSASSSSEFRSAGVLGSTSLSRKAARSRRDPATMQNRPVGRMPPPVVRAAAGSPPTDRVRPEAPEPRAPGQAGRTPSGRGSRRVR